jgi:tetratricopeptide (TPR) repeat protein
VVRKSAGRNTNNDREIYINVDDNPDPFTELRRLLNLNLAYLYGDQTFKALDAGNMPQARAAAQKAVAYSPNSFGSHMRLAFLSYLVGDKQASLDEFAKAKALDPANFDKQWKEDVQFDRFKPMAADKEFLEKLFPNGVPQ